MAASNTAAAADLEVPFTPPELEKDAGLEKQTLPTATSDEHADVEHEKESEAKRRHAWFQNPLKRNPPPLPKERPVNREWDANLLSQVTFWWANNLLAVGYKRPLELQDLPLLSERRRNKDIAERVEADFRRRVARGDKHPLLFALNRTFFKEFWFGGFCQLIAIILLTLSPLMLKYIIQYSSDAYYGDHTNTGRGVGLAIGVIVMQLTGALSINQWAYRSLIVGGMTRGSLISMIYAKSQVISARARAGGSGTKQPNEGSSDTEDQNEKANKTSDTSDEGWSNGRVSNLMSTDTSRINQAVEWSQLLVTTPVQLAIALVQLVINLGASALPGFGLLLVMGPGLYFLTRSLARRRVKTNKITDARISLTQELLSSIRFVKYFAWEKYFLDKLEVLRKKEIAQVQILLGVRSAITSISVVRLLSHHP